MTEISELARRWARYPIAWEPKVSKDGALIAWTWTGYTRKDRRGHRPPQTPADVALCAQRRADRAQMEADRAACAVHPVNKPKEKA